MGDPLTAFLSSENVPRVTPYFGSNVEKPTITRDDRHVVDDNAFDIPEIAAALHLSVKTVSTHKSRIMERLGLSSMAALVRYGLQHGLCADVAAGDGADVITTSPGKLE